MSRLKDFFTSLTALNDWQDEAERAKAVSANAYGCKAVASKQTDEPIVIKRDALILDLCAYREKKQTA